MSDLYDAVVVGGGAAGLSAALTLGRACRRTLVLDEGRPRNAVAERMHGMISRDGIPPLELLAVARAELNRYENVGFVPARVDAISGEAGAFEVRAGDSAVYRARSVLLATGVYDALPAIEGLQEAWGRTAFVCPYCDGWEMRGKRIAVVGDGTKAVELACELRQWSRDIIVCAQGHDALDADHLEWLKATNTPLVVHAIRRIHASEGNVQRVEFEGGEEERCDAIFFSAPLRPRYPLVDMLGCKLRQDGEVEIDERGRTSTAGVYAAGDLVTTVHQVVLAAASGVCAAMALNEDRVREEARAAVRHTLDR